MKQYPVLFLGLILAILAVNACNPRAEKKATHPMVGLWRLDSLSSPEGNAEIGLPLLAMAMQDSTGKKTIDFYFTQDSIFYDFTDGDTTRAAYRFDAAGKTIVFTVDNELRQLLYRMAPDSTMILTDEDSVSLYLRRKD